MKEYTFLICIKEVNTHRVYVNAKTKKEALKRVIDNDIDEWGKDYGSEDYQLVQVMDDNDRQKTLWEDQS